MRAVVGIALILVGLGLFLGRVQGVSIESRTNVGKLDWVRTAQGWERTNSWSTAAPVSGASLHPLVVAAAQSLTSVLALVACATAHPIDPRRLWRMAWTGR